MRYETVVLVSQIASLVLFILLFAVVILYALWPGNQKGFDEAARLPLGKDEDEDRHVNGSQA